MNFTVTRRDFVASLGFTGATLAATKSDAPPSEIRRYIDSATENPVFRLTDAAHQSWLPAPYNHPISRKDNFLIYSSDRAGPLQAYRLEFRSGQVRPLTETADLLPESLTLGPNEREFLYLAGRSVYLGRTNEVHAREVYRAEEGFTIGTGSSLSEDGLVAAVIEQKPGMSRLRLITMRSGAAATVVESSEPISDPQPRPRRAGLLYRKGSELWVVNYDGAQNRRLRIAPGGLGAGLWSGDGRSVVYLNLPADPARLHNIREFTPDTNQDQFVSNTTQYATFNRNADTSVFVGASGSKASPFILLLVRSVQRELTLCEHKAGDPRNVTTFFAPNSQRIFFQSDREGKMAIYSMAVDRLVSKTESAEP